MNRPTAHLRKALATALLASLVASPALPAQSAPASAASSQGAAMPRASMDLPVAGGRVRVSMDAGNIVHLQWLGGAKSTVPMVIAPDRKAAPARGASVRQNASGSVLTSPLLTVTWSSKTQTLSITDAKSRTLLYTDNLAALAQGRLTMMHDAGEPMYGVSGYTAFEHDVDAGMLRQGKLTAESGEQGWTGAPLAWSTAGYGVLAAMDGGKVDLGGDRITVANATKTPMDVYLLVGAPPEIFGAVAAISGRTPLFPKWAMGFTNSQWGIDQKQLLNIVDIYRTKHIPIDNFTLDFDWKAWGQDNYGEFRWNPENFPGGPSGELKKQMDARGMQLTGIMKPRIHVNTVEGRYATEHHFWVPGEKVSDDYFSHKPVKDIDFDIPAARVWFGDLAIKYGFDKGIVGWWNDEADTIGSDTEFMNMQRGIYNAQRRVSNLRVWSVNRNFYLGSQRYAYGVWSGDIDTGFASMAGQRARMLSAINVGAMQWGMDGGGFQHGTPSPENYARWIEFGAFTPIFRVHGTFEQKRQPWVYGAVAEKASTDAIRLRYALIPYLYSYEWQRRSTGVGIVRPLTFDWPNDPKVRNDIASWMFGEGLLVSPVVKQGATSKAVYLPAGTWTHWFSGKTYSGGQTVTLAIDAKSWADIPLFIRQGAIIPMQPPMDYVGEKPLTQATVAIFPDARRTTFDYYDDDGKTYAYEKGQTFQQTLTTQRTERGVKVEILAATGPYKPALRSWLLQVHGITARTISDASLKAYPDLSALKQAEGEGWATGKDRFGQVTYLRVEAGLAKPTTLQLMR